MNTPWSDLLFSSICSTLCCTSHSKGKTDRLFQRSKAKKISAVSPIERNGNVSTQSTTELNFVPFTQLNITPRQLMLVQKHWDEVLVVQKKDIFHKTMLFSIEASPKLNEIIACQKYCVRDLTQWPKLNKICQAQFDFFHHLIFNLNLDVKAISAESQRLGRTHCEYAKYGLKPQFLDIWQQSFTNLAEKLKIPDPEEKKLFLDAWQNLLSYIIEWMNYSYSKHMSEQRQKSQNR